MESYILRFTLESDATFGRGDGVAGLVDAEVAHDELGCPYLNGRALKGNLVNACADVLSYLPKKNRERWSAAAVRLFGTAGSTDREQGRLRVGHAALPEDLRQAIRRDLEAETSHLSLDREQDQVLRLRIENAFRIAVLDTLTAIRAQTAIDAETGVAKDHSLRSMRVILRKTIFEAELNYEPPAAATERMEDLAILSAAVKAFRRAGTGRNRGRGRLVAELLDKQKADSPGAYYTYFQQEVRK